MYQNVDDSLPYSTIDIDMFVFRHANIAMTLHYLHRAVPTNDRRPEGLQSIGPATKAEGNFPSSNTDQRRP